MRFLFTAVFAVALAVAAAVPGDATAAPPNARVDSREQPLGTEPFTADVYKARRAKLQSLMKKGVGVVLSETSADAERQDPDFMYLTGLAHERNGALVLRPEDTDEDARTILLLAAARPESDRVSGYRAVLPNRALEQRLLIPRIGRYEGLPGTLAGSAQQFKTLHYFGPAVGFNQDVPRVLDMYQKTSARVIGAHIEDSQTLLGRMRMVKEAREIDRIARATDITVAGHLEAMRRVKPGMHEWELKQVVEDTFRRGGARRLSYPSIVGGGPDGCVLHYEQDDRVIEDGELVLIDAGAELDHYATDVTRTFPASGHFTPEQRRIYETVLRAQNAALAKVRPGVTWNELQRAAQKVIADAGYYDYYIHGLGHHVGLEVHDLGGWAYREPLVEGAVITIEPGIYIPEKRIGVRIEDTVVVTKTGPRILSAALPRDPDAIEKLMAEARRKP